MAGVSEVAVTNLTPTFYTTLASTILLAGVIVRQWVPLRKMRLDADGRLIETLTERVSTLEKKLEDERTRHENEVSLLRHRANNSDQCIDAVIMLMENADGLPERLQRAIASLKDMRARQKAEEALEKGAIKGARLPPVDPEIEG